LYEAGILGHLQRGGAGQLVGLAGDEILEGELDVQARPFVNARGLAGLGLGRRCARHGTGRFDRPLGRPGRGGIDRGDRVAGKTQRNLGSWPRRGMAVAGVAVAVGGHGGGAGRGRAQRGHHAGGIQFELDLHGALEPLRRQRFDTAGKIAAHPVELETIGRRDPQHRLGFIEGERDERTYPGAVLLRSEFLL